MKLGLLTAPFPETPLMDVADWTAASGFESLEIACWPREAGTTRRYAGTSHIDVASLSAEQATELVDEIASKGLTISGLGYYPNPLHPDPEHRAKVISHLKDVITAAEAMSVPYVNTFMGADGSKNQDANWDEAQRVWPDIVSFAQDHGRKVTIENCPMLFSYDEWPGGHVEGFADTFAALFRAIYADVAAGRPAERPPYATFAEGHDEMLVNDAIAASAASGRWVDVAREPVPAGSRK